MSRRVSWLMCFNSSLSEKVSGFTSDTYEAVTGLAYDATNKKLGLKVGADTVIPFKSGGGLTKIYSGIIKSAMTLDVSEYKKTETNGFIAVGDTYSGISPAWSPTNPVIDFVPAYCNWDVDNGILTVNGAYARGRDAGKWGEQVAYANTTVYYYN